jgi:cobalt-precorrin 5A hydrolase
MAFLTGKKIDLHDPFGLLDNAIPDSHLLTPEGSGEGVARVFVDDTIADLPSQTLVLRPRSLVAGMGCNRGTPMEEMNSLLYQVLDECRLSPASLRSIASINIKANEPGLLELAKALELPVVFYDKEELNSVKNIKNPSTMVEKHTGAKSVCEAAAILSAKRGQLIVPKHSTRNATVAIARIPFTS